MNLIDVPHIIFTINHQRYNLPLSQVYQVHHVPKLHFTSKMLRFLLGYYQLGGDWVFLIAPEQIIDPDVTPVIKNYSPVIVTRTQPKVGWLVDSVDSIEKSMQSKSLPATQSVNGCMTHGHKFESGESRQLDPQKLLLQQEIQAISVLQQEIERRLTELENVE